MLAGLLTGLTPSPVLAQTAPAEPVSCITPPAPVLPAAINSRLKQSGENQAADEILISADSARVTNSETTTFSGNVLIVHHGRKIRADQASYHRPSSRLDLTGNVRLESEEGDVFESDQAKLQVDSKTGKLDIGRFYFRANQSRGGAKKIILNKDKSITLESVRFSTCPSDNETWSIFFRQLTLDRASDNGIGRHAVLRVHNVPVFYTPYLRFPLGTRRQSGFLFPEFGSDDRAGTTITLPYYFNLAPNYDATVTPRWLSRRGLKTDTEFRYLTKRSAGNVELDYLANDRVTGNERSYGALQHRHRFTERLSASVDAQAVSDTAYFNDLTGGQLDSSPTHLPQRLAVQYQPANWIIDAQAVDYQILDTTLAPGEIPYRRIPQLGIRMMPLVARNGLSTSLTMQYGQFDHPTLESAQRINVQPTIRYPIQKPWGYLVPAVSGYFISYQDRSVGSDTSISNTVVSLDSGLLFERKQLGRSGWSQTLEPRAYYIYSPYVDQSSLPVFDTAEAELNFDRLFRENRFVGGDRIGDSNRLTLAVGTRLLDEHGSQRLHAMIGQSFFFEDRRVSTTAAPPETASTSETLLELSANLSNRWYARSTWSWDSLNSETGYSRQFLQYQPGRSRILNFGYRYLRGDGESADLSAQWKLGPKWSVYSRLQYQLTSQTNLASFAGLQYRACCWSLQTLASQRVDSTGQQVRAFQLQLTLTGLGGGPSDIEGLPRSQSVFFDR